MHIGVFIRACEIHSQIMAYISKNFQHLVGDKYIHVLTKDELALLLKHKFLNVTQEDQAVHAVCLWLQG